MKTKITLLSIAAASLLLSSCCGTNSQSSTTKKQDCMATKTEYVKKYTNADFYKEGVFQEEVAKAAFIDLFEFYGYEITPFLMENWWVADFGLGDFENCGMGGVFWLNDPVNGYFSHDIYLLPGQMIPEHKHVKTDHPAKIESWMVRAGWVYNFSEVGEPTPDAPQIPTTQQASTISKKFVKQTTNGIVHLADAGAETWHFLMAGPGGAIVHEYANYHDGAGLRFSNPAASM